MVAAVIIDVIVAAVVVAAVVLWFDAPCCDTGCQDCHRKIPACCVVMLTMC